MRNELNNVTSKLFKTELESQKVELALGMSVSDIKKAFDTSVAEDNSSTAIRQIKEAVMSLQNSAKSLSVRSDKFLKDWDLFQANVKGLGLDVPSDVKDLGNFAKGNLSRAKAMYKAADSILKATNI